jgi:endonuclease YncB( thermonuclease family)
MAELNDFLFSRRARLAERMTELVESDRRVGRCKRVVFSYEGGAMVAVELVAAGDAASRGSIARELEFAIAEAMPALPWASVQIV